MTTCKISLRALSHPVTLTSIILLLLNDHVFKVVAPSILTGKLSDFAGLFFFPFLLAFLLGLLLDWRKISPRHLAITAFAITLFWFSAIKIWPFANSQTTLLVSRLMGFPTQIVLDPSDLLALIVLWPAWRLWKRIERQPPTQPNRSAYLALGLASLAAMATQPCPPEIQILRLETDQQSFYTSPFYDGYINTTSPMFLASDTGQNWETIDQSEVPEEIVAELQQTTQLPVVVCDPKDSATCFRAAKPDQLEGSTDGGDTWETIWRLPLGRRYYMERHLGSTLLSCKQTPDQGPYDLALLSKDGQHTLIAALGNEGVLVLHPDGNWERYGVLDASPTPYSGEGMPLILMVETGLSMVLATLLWLIWSLEGIQAVLRATHVDAEPIINRALAPLGYGALGFIGCLILFIVLFISNTITDAMTLIPPAAILSLLVGSIVAWIRTTRQSNHPALARRAFGITLIATLGIFPLSWLPFVAWVFGLIPIYLFALILALAFAAIDIRWQGAAIKKIKEMQKTNTP